jgi:hypothetical protein
MNRLALPLLALVLSACSAPPLTAPERFVTELQDGLAVEGEIHGAMPDLNQFVFTFRNPGKFFEFVEVSLVAEDPELRRELAGLRRHDRVRITGRLMDNPSPQMHVVLSSLEVVKRHEPVPEVPDYGYVTSVPAELEGSDEALFLVHAVHADGGILVVEHGDVVLPVFMDRPELARDLARNDVVRLAYEVRTSPGRPVHLELKPVEQPIEVIESVMAMHGQPASVEGALVLFPKSPQVKFNVFAVLDELPGELKRQYTLAHFDDPEVFAAIREKLQAAWDAAGEGSSESGRNKLVSTTVRVRATGKFNEVDANQANVQIILDGPDAVEILPN